MIRTPRLRRPLPVAISLALIAVTAMIGALAPPAGVARAVSFCNTPYNPVISPADFTDANGKPNAINNPYSPLVPGTTFVYEGTTKDGQSDQIVVTVTKQTKAILGVTTTVVQDEETIGGQLVERTFDWFAQHDDGSVWYFGEQATEFPSGSTAGSWEAGQDGAKPGILMEAHPAVGDTYRQEYAQGLAEDVGSVRNLDADVSVPYGTFDNALQTTDSSCIETGSEDKYYAPGVGLVQEVESPQVHVELVSVTRR